MAIKSYSAWNEYGKPNNNYQETITGGTASWDEM